MRREIFLLLSFLVALGLIGSADLGGSMLNLLWLIPITLANAVILFVEYEKGNVK